MPLTGFLHQESYYLTLMGKEFGLSMNQAAELAHAGDAPTFETVDIKPGWVFGDAFGNEAAMEAIVWPEAEIVQALLDKVDELEEREANAHD